MRPQDLQKGDIVRCLVTYYQSYRRNEEAVIRYIMHENGNWLIILKNDLTMYGESKYCLQNWEFVRRPEIEKEAKTVGYTKTLYFGGKIDPLEPDAEARSIPRIGSRTVGRYSKSEAIKDVRSVIQEGEEWLLLQTVAVIKHAEPEPQLAKVNITECR